MPFRIPMLLLLPLLMYGCESSGEKNYVIFKIPPEDNVLAATTGCLVDRSCGWSVEVVDTGAGSPENAAGSVHVSYAGTDGIDPANNELRYATKDESEDWIVTTVDGDGVGWYSSIGVDSEGNVHISYYDNVNRSLKYATNASGSWTTTRVYSGSPDTGRSTSLVIDSYDRVHIAFYDAGNRSLMYSTNASGQWFTSTIDSASNPGWASSLAIDEFTDVDRLYVAYADIYGNIKYAAKYPSSDWIKFTVDSIGSSTELPWQYLEKIVSLDVDADGYAHMAYYDIAGANLKYATNASDSWVTGTLDATGNVGREVSIKTYMDGGQTAVLIFYLDEDTGRIKYAVNSEGGSGSWVTYTPAISGRIGAEPSLSISESSGEFNITFLDPLNSQVVYISPFP